MRRFLFLLPLLTLLGVGVYFIFTTSPLVRYWVDDFCSAIPVRNGGFWGAQVGWWQTWTGRYSFIAFLDIFELLGQWSVKFIPILLSLFLIITLIPVFSFEIILAPLFVMLALINSPNLIQSFYWQMGTFNYTIEYIFLNLFFVILVKLKGKFIVPIAFLLLLIAGGFSEAYALSQIVLVFFVVLILLVGNFSDKKMRLTVAIVGLLGAITSVIIMSLSPGNSVRASISDHPSSLLFVVKSTFYGTKWYLQRMLLVKPFVISLLLIFSSIFVTVSNKQKMFSKMFCGTKKMLIIIALSILAAVFSTASVIFSGYYATAYTPPERTMFIAIYSILISFIMLSFSGSILLINLASKRVSQFVIWIAIATILFSSTFLTVSTYSHWAQIKAELSAYIQNWTPEEKILAKAQENGEKTAVIKNVKSVGQLDDFIQNKGWVLGCLRAYYNLNEIKLK